MSRGRQRYSPQFKLKAVLDLLKCEKTAAQISGELGVHPMVISGWKKHFNEVGFEIFEKPKKTLKAAKEEKEKSELYEQIGRLKIDNDWLKKKLGLLT